MALAARHAAVAVAAEPAHRDAITDGEVLDAVAQLGDGARGLVAERYRPRQSRKVARVELAVGATHPAAATAMRTWSRGGETVSTSVSASGPSACAT